jgi:hypothetical protein
MGLVTPAEAARSIGVSRQAISKAIKVGRITAHDASGLPVAADYSGKKFIDPGEAVRQFALNRARIDDTDIEASPLPDLVAAAEHAAAVQASDTLTGVRRDTEQLKAELLKLRLARERGDTIDRAAAEAALESAGRAVAEAIAILPGLAEEIFALAKTGTPERVAAFLTEKAEAIRRTIADKLEIDLDDADLGGDGGDEEGG